MNPGTWTGFLFWVCTVGAFWAGSRWGRSRERYVEAMRRLRAQAEHETQR